MPTFLHASGALPVPRIHAEYSVMFQFPLWSSAWHILLSHVWSMAQKLPDVHAVMACVVTEDFAAAMASCRQV